MAGAGIADTCQRRVYNARYVLVGERAIRTYADHLRERFVARDLNGRDGEEAESISHYAEVGNHQWQGIRGAVVQYRVAWDDYLPASMIHVQEERLRIG